MENTLIVVALIFAVLSLVLGVRLIWKETQPAPLDPHTHVWNWIAFPHIRQCKTCPLIQVLKDDPLSDELKDYVSYLDGYYKTNMFPKSAVTGYHLFRAGCCPLPPDDPIHDPNLVSKLNERFN